MTRQIVAGATLALALAACGGGGSATSGNGLPPGPTPTPVHETVSGEVVQMTGPLSSATWNMAAPTGCDSTSCTNYPAMPANLPGPSATPGAGAGIGSVTVYAVANADAAGIPAAPIATATTAPDGSFTISLPASAPATVGLIAVDGTSISTATGTTNLGYTVAHKNGVTLGSTGTTLYLDTLDADEQSGATALNGYRQQANLPVVTVDTMAEAAARLGVAQDPTVTNCLDLPTAAISDYVAWTGITNMNPNPVTLATILNYPSWATAANGGSAWSKPMSLAGFAGLYQAPSCSSPSGSISYHVAIYS